MNKEKTEKILKTTKKITFWAFISGGIVIYFLGRKLDGIIVILAATTFLTLHRIDSINRRLKEL